MSIGLVLLEGLSPGLHIPDGFISPLVGGVGWLLTIGAVGYASARAKRTIDERAVPLMGVMAAFIFAAQMINFPVAGGTSGHLLGGTLAAVLLGGPWTAIIVMTAVIALQALLFQDGGIVALGVNVLNMGVLTTLVGYALYRVTRGVIGGGSTGTLAGAALGAWVSVEVAALATSLQLAVSGTSPLEVALPAMLGVHAVIGLGEAAITVAAIAFVAATRPELMPRGASSNRGVA